MIEIIQLEQLFGEKVNQSLLEASKQSIAEYTSDVPESAAA